MSKHTGMTISGWVRVKAAAQYAGVSERTLRNWLKDGLRHSRVSSGTILIKLSWVDEYLEAREVHDDRMDRMLDEILRGLKKG